MGFGGEDEGGEGGEDGSVEAAGGGGVGGVVVVWEEDEEAGAVAAQEAEVLSAVAEADAAGVEVEGEDHEGDGEEDDDGHEHDSAARSVALCGRRIVLFFRSWNIVTVTISSHFGFSFSLSPFLSPLYLLLKQWKCNGKGYMI